MLYRILTRLGFCRRLHCRCGAIALTYDETRGYCGPCYLRTMNDER